MHQRARLAAAPSPVAPHLVQQHALQPYVHSRLCPLAASSTVQHHQLHALGRLESHAPAGGRAFSQCQALHVGRQPDDLTRAAARRNGLATMTVATICCWVRAPSGFLLHHSCLAWHGC